MLDIAEANGRIESESEPINAVGARCLGFPSPEKQKQKIPIASMPTSRMASTPGQKAAGR